MLGQEKGLLARKIDELALAMEKMKLAEYVDYLHNTKKMLVTNFIAGIAPVSYTHLDVYKRQIVYRRVVT